MGAERIDSPYYAALGMHQDPFHSDWPVDDLYQNQNLQQRLNLLRHLIQSSDLLLLIEGPDGAGKSALMQRLGFEPPVSWDVCLVQADATTTPLKLLAQMAQCYGATAAAADVHSLQTTVRQRLQTLTDHERLPVLAIDDAEQLPADTLSTLLKLHEPLLVDGVHTRLVRLALFAKPELGDNETFATHEHLEPDSVHRMEPVRLQQSEISEFILHRLQASGLTDTIPFDETEINEFFWRSEGLPGAIIELARQRLDTHSTSKRTRRVPKKSLLITSVGVVSLAALWILWQQIGRESWWQPDPSKASAPEWHSAPAPVTTVDLRPQPPKDEETSAIAKDVPVGSTPTSAATPETSAQIIDKTDTPTDPVPTAVAEVANPAPPEIPEPMATETAASADTIPAPKTVVPESAKDNAPEPELTRKPITAPETNIAPRIKSTEWLKQQAPERYTLQLLALSKRSAVEAYARRYELGEPLVVIEKPTSAGGTFSVLMWGNFSSREAAVSAIERLPKAVRKAKPWPRSFGSIQKSL